MGHEKQIIGKRGELSVLGELLKRGFDIYIPLVDVGIDCVVRTKGNNFKEIQIKTRTPTDKGRICDVKMFEPKGNFFIIYRLDGEKDENGEDIYWIIPSEVFYSKANLARKGEFLRVGMNDKRKSEIKDYKNNFGLLE